MLGFFVSVSTRGFIQAYVASASDVRRQDCNLLFDLDFCVLGSTAWGTLALSDAVCVMQREGYDEYAETIRLEYSHVPLEDFRAKRS